MKLFWIQNILQKPWFSLCYFHWEKYSNFHRPLLTFLSNHFHIKMMLRFSWFQKWSCFVLNRSSKFRKTHFWYQLISSRRTGVRIFGKKMHDFGLKSLKTSRKWWFLTDCVFCGRNRPIASIRPFLRYDRKSTFFDA